MIAARTAVVSALIGLLAGAAQAAIDPKKVCNAKHLVDHEQLAGAMLDSATTSRHLESLANALRSGADGPPPYTSFVLSWTKLCPTGGACTADEAKEPGEVYDHFQDFLKNPGPGFKNTSGKIDPIAFLQDPKATVECTTTTVAASELGDAAESSSKKTFPLRVRGAADSFDLVPGDTRLASVSKATLSLGDDGTAHKRTDKTAVFVALPVPLDGVDGALYPYAGIDRQLSKTSGKAQSTTEDFYSVGVQVSVFNLPGEGLFPGTAQRLLIRPDYTVTMTDHTKIASLNAAYIPLIDREHSPVAIPLNIYLPVGAADWKTAIEPMLEIHADAGWYTDRGTMNQADHLDFSHIGPKYGFAVATKRFTDNPVTLTVTDTELFRIAGRPKDLTYFSTDLSVPLSSNIFSLELTYTNGRREDTLARENTWGISLAGKY